MTIREKIWADLVAIRDHRMLLKVLDFIHKLNKADIKSKGNSQVILSHAGILSDQDKKEIKRIIDDEFYKIEGDWSP